MSLYFLIWTIVVFFAMFYLAWKANNGGISLAEILIFIVLAPCAALLFPVGICVLIAAFVKLDDTNHFFSKKRFKK